MSRRIVDLSFTIHEGMTTFPSAWHPFVEITQLGRHGIECRESRKLVLGTHTGTHVDAPSHFIPGGKSIDQIPLDVFVGPARVLNFSHALPLQEIQVADFETQLKGEKPERIIMRFDWSSRWGTLDYYQSHPFISEEAASWLVKNGIRLLAMDTPQADSPKNGRGATKDSPVHKILLGNDVIKVEYLTNLSALKRTHVELVALPLKIRDSDGSPIRCIAIEED